MWGNKMIAIQVQMAHYHYMKINSVVDKHSAIPVQSFLL